MATPSPELRLPQAIGHAPSPREVRIAQWQDRIAVGHARLPLSLTPEEAAPLEGDAGVLHLPALRVHGLRARVEVVRATIPRLPHAFETHATETPHATDDAFDPNLFLPAFRTVRLRPGLVLDYVWRGTHHEGAPLLYARDAAGPPLRTVADFEAHFGVEVKGFAPNFPAAYVEALEVDETPFGLVERAVFLHEVPFFHWFWHAMYERVDLVTSPADLDTQHLREVGRAAAENLRALPLGAHVRWADDQRWVELLVHRNNVGYVLRTWAFRAGSAAAEVTDRVVARTMVQRFY